MATVEPEGRRTDGEVLELGTATPGRPRIGVVVVVVGALALVAVPQLLRAARLDAPAAAVPLLVAVALVLTAATTVRAVLRARQARSWFERSHAAAVRPGGDGPVVDLQPVVHGRARPTIAFVVRSEGQVLGLAHFQPRRDHFDARGSFRLVRSPAVPGPLAVALVSTEGRPALLPDRPLQRLRPERVHPWSATLLAVAGGPVGEDAVPVAATGRIHLGPVVAEPVVGPDLLAAAEAQARLGSRLRLGAVAVSLAAGVALVPVVGSVGPMLPWVLPLPARWTEERRRLPVARALAQHGLASGAAAWSMAGELLRYAGTAMAAPAAQVAPGPAPRD